jgi:hypothetical protein
MRIVDGLSLFFLDLYVPALTPLLDGTETSLQLSENITDVGTSNSAKQTTPTV